MFIELIDILRCTADHADIPLVAAILARQDRDVITGILGCPSCGAEYRIERGIAIFGERQAPGPPLTLDRNAAVHANVSAADDAEANAEADRDAAADAAVRCAAMLNLLEPGGAAVLAGAWMRSAPALLALTRTSLLLLDPPDSIVLGGGVAGIRAGDALPLAPGSLRGVALDGMWGTPSLIDSAARALAPGGRLVAPGGVALPAGVVERARDDMYWVAEAESTASAPVQLKPRARQP